MKKNRPLALPALLLALGAMPAHARDPGDVSHWEITATDIITGVIPLGALWRTYNIEDSEGRHQFLWSTGTTLVVVNSLRLALNDTEWGQRPNGHPYGFPSGHLAFVGAGAAFLQNRYGWAWGIPAWIGAAYVAEVRVSDDHHRWRDVLVSSAFAIGSSYYFTTEYPDKTVKPLFGDNGEVGLEVVYRFD